MGFGEISKKGHAIVKMDKRDFNIALRSYVWSQILSFKKLEDLFFPEGKLIDILIAKTAVMKIKWAGARELMQN